MRRFLKLLDRVEAAMAVVAGLLLIAITASVCLEVFMRYVLAAPLSWVVEMSEYGLLYICFLGTAWALRADKHVRIDIALNSLPTGMRQASGVIASLLGLGISLVLLIWGSLAVWEKYVLGSYKPTLLHFPTWIVLLCIPLGSLFLGIRFLRNMVEYASGTHSDQVSYESELE